MGLQFQMSHSAEFWKRRSKYGHQKLWEKPALLCPEMAKHDPDFLRFAQGVFDPICHGVQEMYFLCYRANNNALPRIDDRVKAEVVQEFGSSNTIEGITARQKYVGLMRKKSAVLGDRIVLLDRMARQQAESDRARGMPADTALRAGARMLSEFCISHAMITRQLDNLPTLDDAVLEDAVRMADFVLPTITADYLTALSKEIVDSNLEYGNLQYRNDDLQRKDPALLRFFRGLEEYNQCDAFAVRSAYTLLYRAAKESLPHVPGSIMAQVVQDMGPNGSESRENKAVAMWEDIARTNAQYVAWVTYTQELLSSVSTRKVSARAACEADAVEHPIMLYEMLRRTVEKK
jgi:hypothetical protein